MFPLSTIEKLRIQFRKRLRRGVIKNAEMDPVLPQGMTVLMEPEETVIVRVDSTKGPHDWFTPWTSRDPGVRKTALGDLGTFISTSDPQNEFNGLAHSKNCL